MPDTSVKAIAEMTNEEILDRLRQIIICIKSPDDIQEAGDPIKSDRTFPKKCDRKNELTNMRQL